MRELLAQFVAEEKIVERNQHDPIRQTDNANEQEPHKHAAHNVATNVAWSCLDIFSRSARGIIAATIAASAVKPSNQ